MESNLERQLYGTEYISFNLPDQTNLSMTKAAFAHFLAPFTGNVVEVTAGYVTEAGTSPSLAVTLERGTTVLTTVSPTTAATPLSSGAISAFVSKGENLNLKLASLGNADNDFTGICIVVGIQRPLTTT